MSQSRNITIAGLIVFSIVVLNVFVVVAPRCSTKEVSESNIAKAVFTIEMHENEYDVLLDILAVYGVNNGYTFEDQGLKLPPYNGRKIVFTKMTLNDEITIRTLDGLNNIDYSVVIREDKEGADWKKVVADLHELFISKWQAPGRVRVEYYE